MTTNLVVKIITTRVELQTISQEWNELLQASQADTIFLNWNWLITWLDNVYPNARLCVVTVRNREGVLLAIAPFYHSELRLLKVFKYKCLRVIGDCQSGAEYGDLIIRNGFEGIVITCVSQALWDYRQYWDCIWINHVSGWNNAELRIKAMCGNKGFMLHERRCNFSMRAVPKTYDSFLASLSRNQRNQIKRKTRQLENKYKVKFISCDVPEKSPEMLDKLFELHHMRWQSVGQKGSFIRRPLMKIFYEQFAPIAFENGWLRIYALDIEGSIKAIQYGYVYKQKFYQLQEGFDTDFFKGIGNVLRNKVFQACIDEEVLEYDNLGGFSEHKRRWGAGQRNGFDFFIAHNSFKNRLLFYKQVWPSGRYIEEGKPANDGRGG